MKSTLAVPTLRHVLLSVVIVSLAPPVRAAGDRGDPQHGRTVFEQNCALCHDTSSGAQATVEKGPPLGGIVGRRAGVWSRFGYTQALIDSQLIWTEDNLDRFLANPSGVVPNTSMAVAVPDETDRRDLVAYLATLHTGRGGAPAAIVPRGPEVPASRSGDWREDGPGVHHLVGPADLPPPYATRSAGNSPRIVSQPYGARLSAPPGFTVRLFASGLSGPRLLRVAPNGDILIAETRANRIRILRTRDGASKPSVNRVFAAGLDRPFGIAFYPAGPDPQWVYVANLNSVVRFPYRNGDLSVGGRPEIVVPHLADTTGGHTTRDIAFSQDGQRLFISVGSGSNVAESMPRKSPADLQRWIATQPLGAAWGPEARRADILVTDPTGRQPLRIFATGIRNAVGIAVDPVTGALWASTNERDGLGDDLVPDYITRVREGAFYGWPWYYLGDHEDPRHAGARPDLAGRITVPDVWLQAHSASLQLTFYPANSGAAAFPARYHGDIFAALHGSWNRKTRTGSKVVRVHLDHGKPVGGYEDFLTGFVVTDDQVWGRPVGVAVAHDGALLVSDDANGTIWRVAYEIERL